MSLTCGPAVRLRSSAEFSVVQKTGRRVAGRYLTLLGKPNSLACDRLGIIASRRLGNAVQRNRAKRRVRALFRHQSPDDVGARGLRAFDLVVIPKRELTDAPYLIIEADFVAALRKLCGRGAL
jgi:ribonuclease P protein component